MAPPEGQGSAKATASRADAQAPAAPLSSTIRVGSRSARGRPTALSAAQASVAPTTARAPHPAPGGDEPDGDERTLLPTSNAPPAVIASKAPPARAPIGSD